MIHSNFSHSMNAYQGRRPANGNLGMPDPRRYPDWTPGDRDPRLIGSSARPEQDLVPDYNRYPRDKPGIMGGWDAPMFYDGRVMTRREYAQLHDLGLA